MQKSEMVTQLKISYTILMVLPLCVSSCREQILKVIFDKEIPCRLVPYTEFLPIPYFLLEKFRKLLALHLPLSYLLPLS